MKRDKKTDSLSIRMTPVIKWKLYLVSIREERTVTDIVTEAIEIYLSHRQDIIQEESVSS